MAELIYDQTRMSSSEFDVDGDTLANILFKQIDNLEEMLTLNQVRIAVNKRTLFLGNPNDLSTHRDHLEKFIKEAENEVDSLRRNIVMLKYTYSEVFGADKFVSEFGHEPPNRPSATLEPSSRISVPEGAGSVVSVPGVIEGQESGPGSIIT